MEAVKTPAGILYNATVVRALCLDFDGTIRHSKKDPTGFIAGPDDIALYPDAEAKLWEYKKNDWVICGISNQGGVAHGFKTPQQVNAEFEATCSLFENDPFDTIKGCFHEASGTVFPFNYRSLSRKPSIGMLVIIEMGCWESGYVIDWDNSLFVGDRPEDQQCAANAGIPFQWAHEFFGRPDPAPLGFAF